MPVEGLKLNFVEVTLAGRFPVFAVTQTGYIVALVEVSLVMPIFTALVAVPTESVLCAAQVGEPVPPESKTSEALPAAENANAVPFP
jgi:hypothetical protein